jgi:hypothetical protein
MIPKRKYRQSRRLQPGQQGSRSVNRRTRRNVRGAWRSLAASQKPTSPKEGPCCKWQPTCVEELFELTSGKSAPLSGIERTHWQQVEMKRIEKMAYWYFKTHRPTFPKELIDLQIVEFLEFSCRRLSLDRYDPRRPAWPYLKRIFRNRFVMRIPKQRLFEIGIVAKSEFVTQLPSQNDDELGTSLAFKELSEASGREIQELSQDQRQCLLSVGRRRNSRLAPSELRRIRRTRHGVREKLRLRLCRFLDSGV